MKLKFYLFFPVTSKVISLGGDFLEGRSIPLWILLLAVLAGLIFLALVSLVLWHFGFFRRRRRQQFEDHNGLQNGSIINANDANMYLHEATVAEKQPLAVATVTTNGFHHRQNRHSRHSLTYPHHMQPGDEVNKQILKINKIRSTVAIKFSVRYIPIIWKTKNLKVLPLALVQTWGIFVFLNIIK